MSKELRKIPLFEDKDFFEWWAYQQKYSIIRIIDILKRFIIFFPFGFLEAIVNLIIGTLTFPLLFARGVHEWSKKALWSDILDEDLHKKVYDHEEYHHLEHVHHELYDFSTSFTGKAAPFILGVLATLLTTLLAFLFTNR